MLQKLIKKVFPSIYSKIWQAGYDQAIDDLYAPETGVFINDYTPYDPAASKLPEFLQPR